MKNKAAQQLGSLGGSVKSKAKTETARANGAKGGRPGGHTVFATEKGYDIGPKIFLATSVSAQDAKAAAKAAAKDGYEGVFIEFRRKSNNGQICYLNPDGSYDITGACWD